MSKCIGCNKSTNGEIITVIENTRNISFGYSYFYNLCNKCQGEMLKPLEAIPRMLKGIQDYDERRERFSETRNWCRKCWQVIKLDRCAMLFVDSNGYVKNTSYLHHDCCREIQVKWNMINLREKREDGQSCLI